MKLFRNLFVTCSAVLTVSLPALAGVTVNSPEMNSDVSSPFTFRQLQRCAPRANVMRWDIHLTSSSDTTVVNTQSINKSVCLDRP